MKISSKIDVLGLFRSQECPNELKINFLAFLYPMGWVSNRRRVRGGAPRTPAGPTERPRSPRWVPPRPRDQVMSPTFISAKPYDLRKVVVRRGPRSGDPPTPGRPLPPGPGSGSGSFRSVVLGRPQRGHPRHGHAGWCNKMK